MFGGLGDFMKKAQEMQGAMQEMKERMGRKMISGEAGGGLVRATVSGTNIVQNIEIDPSIFVASEQKLVQDLIVAALNNAFEKSAEYQQEELKKITGGLPNIPGLNLPF